MTRPSRAATLGEDGLTGKPLHAHFPSFLPSLPTSVCPPWVHDTVPSCHSPLHSRKADAISPLDDLAFDMYQDPEVAQIIRKLDEKKHEAVHLEHYDHAKKLKQAIADLQKVVVAEQGGEGPRWETQKGTRLP